MAGKKGAPLKKARSGTPSFEEALHRLEAIVDQLEAAEVPLDKALALYEQGVGLARACNQQLKSAERRVELLEDRDGELKGKPWDAEHDPAMSSGDPEDEDEDDDEDADQANEADDEEGPEAGKTGGQGSTREDQEKLF